MSDARDLITGADPVIATPGNALLDGKWVSVDLARSGLLENLGATVICCRTSPARSGATT